MRLLAGGSVVDGSGAAPYPADVLVDAGRIVAVMPRLDGPRTSVPSVASAPEGTDVLDCTGRLVMPGFVDAHAHAEGRVFHDDVQLALLRQGITTVIGGQDGVSYAPGDGAYSSRYFAAINGDHPSYRGPGVAELLSSYDDVVPVNVAYLVPAGTVRHEVMGDIPGPASAEQLARMISLVARGVAEGAVGLSTGLDYTPGIFADAEEIAALCGPVAAAGLPYVSHLRGGYEENAEAGVQEAALIADRSGVAVHFSHFHTRAAEAWRLMDAMQERGVSATFDAYPYTRGCSLLAMPLLPPELNSALPDDAAAALREPSVRERLRRDWFPAHVAGSPSLGPEWPDLITVGHTAAPEFAWAHGLTLTQIAARRGTDAVDAALELLADSRLEVNAIMAVQNQRPVSDLGRLISHPRHLGGSDGIFVGAHQHPRARGTFAAYLGTYVRETEHLSWADAVGHLATRPSELFRLGRRGRLRPGWVADIVVVDPERVGERADYDQPMRPAEGIDDVLVAGVPVLAGGSLTGATPGCGLRAEPHTDPTTEG